MLKQKKSQLSRKHPMLSGWIGRKRQSSAAIWKGKGFTIVEVTIALAIGALIFTIIFAYVPKLQKSQRDNYRKDLTLRIKTSLESFSANHTGAYAFTGVAAPDPPPLCNTIGDDGSGLNCGAWFNQYVKDKINIKDPTSGNDINIYYTNNTDNPPDSADWPGNVWTPGTVYIIVDAKCDPTNTIVNVNGSSAHNTGNANSRSYALLTQTESISQPFPFAGQWFCVDNS